jgi:hypothetical protein
VLGDIYLGKITKWNDAGADGLNPGVPLPDAAIAVVRRADGSGTSFIFTNYLSKVNAEWKAKVGEGTAVNWPTGAGGKGNEGVAAFVQRLPNSIGYVEYAYVKQNKMTYVLLKNKDGNFVADDTNFKAAAAGADWNKSFYQITDRAARQGRLADHRCHLHPDAQGAGQAGQRDQLAEVLRLGLRNGDKMADDLDYVPLPDSVKALVRKQWAEIKDAPASPWPSSDLNLPVRACGHRRIAPDSPILAEATWPLHCPPPLTSTRMRCERTPPQAGRRTPPRRALGRHGLFACWRTAPPGSRCCCWSASSCRW